MVSGKQSEMPPVWSAKRTSYQAVMTNSEGGMACMTCGPSASSETSGVSSTTRIHGSTSDRAISIPMWRMSAIFDIGEVAVEDAGVALALAAEQAVDDAEGHIEPERRDGVALKRRHINDDDDGRASRSG